MQHPANQLNIPKSYIIVIEEEGIYEPAEKLSRVLRNDLSIAVIRHADAVYDVAKDVARKYKFDLAERLK